MSNKQTVSKQSAYSDINGQISQLFESELIPAVAGIRDSFRDALLEWFYNFRKDLSKLDKEDPRYVHKKVDLFAQRIPELESLITDLRHFDWAERWVDAVTAAAAKAPEQIETVQGPERFAAQPGDTVYVKLIKTLKRLGRVLPGGTARKQVIPVRLILRSHLMKQTEWYAEFASLEYDGVTRILDQLLEIEQKENQKPVSGEETESDTEQESTEQGEETYTLQFVNRLDDHIDQAIQQLNQEEKVHVEYAQKALEPVQQSCIERLQKAGTFEAGTIKRVDSSTSLGELAAAQKKISGAWKQYMVTQLSDLRVQTDISRYSLNGQEIISGIRQQMHELFRDAVYLPCENGITFLKETIDVLESYGDESEALNVIGKRQPDINQTLHNHLLAHFDNESFDFSGIEHARRAVGTLQADVQFFSSELKLAEKRERTLPSPIVEVDTIQWQKLAARFLKNEAINKLDPESYGFESFLKERFSEMKESVDIVDVNLSAALNPEAAGNQEDEVEEVNPVEIATDGIERAVAALERIIKEAREKQNSYIREMDVTFPKALYRLSATMLNREYDEFEMRDTAYQVKEQAASWRERWEKWQAVFLEKGELALRFATKKYREYSSVVFRFLGFRGSESVSVQEKRNLAEYLSQPGTVNELPHVYKQLFDRNFTIDERFYVPPKPGLTMVESSFDQWSRGLAANVMVIGEKGSGKTTMLRFLKKKVYPNAEWSTLNFSTTFCDEETLIGKLAGHFQLEGIASRNDLIEAILKFGDRRVVEIENIQNIFIRNINGFGALNSFWEVVSSTSDKIYWVVTCSRYSWAFFRKISSSDQYFSHIIEADRLDKEQIEAAVLTRHRASGYEAVFDVSESVKNSRSYKRALDDTRTKQEMAKDDYFTRLSKICEGNMSIAMIFWVQSIKEFDDQSMVIQPIEVADVDKLEIPSTDVLFTLAALVIHDKLTDEEVALALHQPLRESRLMLTRLRSKGIIYRTDGGYSLNHLVYRQVVRLLKRRNVLH
ncbi:MAG: hypothetical protein ACNA78_07635 [Balneolaceae bacterium]